jgi:cell division protein ZapB
MDDVKDSANIESEMKHLESRIDDLVAICQRLRDENKLLRDQQSSLMQERAKLIEKNEMARMRVEAIVSRLKGMERNI